jgi:hypothetical protein
VNKAGANTVYVVLAVAFILTASAKASPAQPIYVLRACIAAQLSLNVVDDSRAFESKSQVGTLSTLGNTGPDATTELRRLPYQPFGKIQSFFPASVVMSCANKTFSTSFINCCWTHPGQNSKYRFAYLKRDLVYVRSKS